MIGYIKAGPGKAIAMRETPDPYGKQVALLPDGTAVDATKLQGEWAYCTSGGNSGWVAENYIVESPGALNGIFDTLKEKGKQLWTSVKSAIGIGTPAAEAAKTTDGTLYVNVTTTLNLRSAPNTSASVVASLKRGDAVTPVAGGTAATGWTYIQTADGKKGYASSAYLSNTAPGSITPAPTPNANGLIPTDNNQTQQPMSITENAKKYLKIAGVGLLAAGVVYGVYKATKGGSTSKPASKRKADALGGVLDGTSKKKGKKKSKKTKKAEYSTTVKRLC